MPNHSTNRLEIKGNQDEIFKLKDFLKGEKTDIDFNNIVKKPKDLDIESSSFGELSQFLLFGTGGSSFLGIKECRDRFMSLDEENKEKEIKAGLTYQRNLEKYGFETWYGWCKKNWGTKWNAYATEWKGDTLIFQTAWNNVSSLIEKLSFVFPELEFFYEWADEDTGYNTGFGRFKNGFIEIIAFEGGSKESYELAFKLNPEEKKHYKFTGISYEWNEDSFE